ncbi:FkbM family methyltransferase [Halobiforma nitratireducens]|uniref:FkbM family methyltransferase n=1 Tax=Halobiforma nitratireducens JCM 10879 TaxID=1227454 RepID=M0LWR1_9EURY|nr:FkbM family methyltransferase [Halobiforma nitratireducens]EMA37598.1 FkbM family methyltransferase [Halobiforma nitratireducens JCM 10879]
MATDDDAVGPASRVRETIETLEGLAHVGYHRLSRVNYEHRGIARRNRTPAGSFRCYEPLNRHGSDAMLAELDATCGPSAVVYDVGANVGVYALGLVAAAPNRRVVAFEPSPAAADRLRANVALNDLEDRIDARTWGIGDEDGTRPFYRSTNPELSAFDRESARRYGASVADVRSVPVRRIDSVAASGASATSVTSDAADAGDGTRLPPPDAVKIDVEGAAPAVLRGAKETFESHRPTVFVEVHEALGEHVPRETRGVLSDVGYAIDERTGYWRCEPVASDG